MGWKVGRESGQAREDEKGLVCIEFDERGI